RASRGIRLVLCGDLARAVRVEPVPVVCRLWGVSRRVVMTWRRLLQVPADGPSQPRYWLLPRQLPPRPEGTTRRSDTGETSPQAPRRDQGRGDRHENGQADLGESGAVNDLNDTERPIVEWLDNHGCARGEAIASGIGFPYNSYFRQTIAGL